MIDRGTICWCDLGPIQGSRPAKRRPVLVVQDDEYNHSGLATVVVAILTSNTSRAQLPGNVLVPASSSGLAKDSTVSVLGLVTVNKDELGTVVGSLPDYLMREVDAGLRRVLGL